MVSMTAERDSLFIRAYSCKFVDEISDFPEKIQ